MRLTQQIEQCVLALLLTASSGACLADSDIDGTYAGTSVGYGTGNCNSTTTSSTIRDGVLYDGSGVAHGTIRQGATLTWQSATRTLHLPETISVQLVGNTIKAVAVEHGGPNCTWKTQ